MEISKEIWNGNLSPITHFGQNNRDMVNLANLIEKSYEKLLECLSENDKNRLNKFKEHTDEYELYMCEQAFHDGFCLGLKIAAEAFTGSEEILK